MPVSEPQLRPVKLISLEGGVKISQKPPQNILVSQGWEPIIHYFHKYVVIPYYTLGPILEAGEVAMNKSHKTSAFIELIC